MIQIKKGDILEERAEAIVNTVNCVGVMGRGIALQFKEAYPENFKAYAAACARHDVVPGRMLVFETGQLMPPRYIINFPTKRHWRGKSRMEDIDAGLKALAEEIQSRDIRSIAIPPLGSGLGGLDWGQVRRHIEAALSGLGERNIVLFEPNKAKGDERPNHSTNVPAITAGRAALIGLVHRYLHGLLDPFITLLEAHKLMYFMQAAGEPLKLKYAKGPYGPYSENIRHVFKAIEGHMLTGYADGDAPDTQLQLVPGALEEAMAFLKDRSETQQRFDRVSDLVEGYESAFGLELLATVHWVVVNEPVQSIADVVAQTHAWSERKKQFTPRQIGLAVDVLARKGWIRAMAPA
jgi:O-acetyl-ADP-ribose deacetylase (regulator of RNase III)